MSGGYLRTGVKVSRTGKSVSLLHAFWLLDLPADWVDTTPEISALLERRVSAYNVPYSDPRVRGVVRLLEAQGCLSYPDDREAYTLRDVRELFRHLSLAWYGTYYAHPLWERLRNGSLSRNGLLAWLLHTYHLSRSAGMSAARSATCLSQPALRALFARSALEEYSHCEDFFFVRHPSLAVTDRQVRSSVHLPSSLAFDQQMLRMAEDDWLGHVLAALFQETTAGFYDQCREFYRMVAAAYGLPDFFRNWERHVELDLEEAHADEFSGVLASEERCTRAELVFSLQNAWLTFQFLLGALDDILGEDRDDDRVVLRMPVEHGALDPDGTMLLAAYRQILPEGGARLQARTAGELRVRMEQLGLAAVPPSCPLRTGTPSPADIDFLQADLARSILRSMSFATAHNEILLLGRLAEEAVRLVAPLEQVVAGNRRQPRSPHSMAVANFFRELATKPLTCAFVLRDAVSLAQHAGTGAALGWLPFGEAGVGLLDEFLARSPVVPGDVDRLATVALQFHELFWRWAACSGEAKTTDMFRD